MTHTRVLALLATLFSTQAFGADWQTDSDRILGDPSFLPVAGQVEGRLGYTYDSDRYDTQTLSQQVFFGGLKPFPFNASYDRSRNIGAGFLSYGITDDISVFASIETGNSRNREAFSTEEIVFHRRPGPRPIAPLPITPLPILAPVISVVPFSGTQEYHAVGTTDPEFGATWRAIDQARAPVSVDLSLSYSPDIFQSRSAGLDQTGSLASGGQAGSAQLAVAREMKWLTVRAFGGLEYLGRQNDRGVGGFSDLRSAPHAVYAGGLQSELRLVPWFAINAGVNAQQAMRYDRFAIFPGGSTPSTIKPGGVISPYVGAVIPIIDRHLVTELLYQHDFIHRASEHSAFQTEEFFHQSSNLLIARLILAFGGSAPRPLPYGDVQPPPPPAPAPVVAPARTYLVFFDWDRADLTARARQIVAQAAQASATSGVTRIRVTATRTCPAHAPTTPASHSVAPIMWQPNWCRTAFRALQSLSGAMARKPRWSRQRRASANRKTAAWRSYCVRKTCAFLVGG